MLKSCKSALSIALLGRLKADSSKAGDVETLVKSLPSDLASSYNIGLADFYPATSGKQNAAEYIVQKLESDLQSSFLMCDDDNDMGKHTAVQWCVLSSRAFNVVCAVQLFVLSNAIGPSF